MANFSLYLTSANQPQGFFQEVSIPEDANIQVSNRHVVMPHTMRNILVLKRGIVLADSPFAEWCRLIFEKGMQPVMPRDITVSLLNDKGGKEASWHFTNAHPVKCEVAENVARGGEYIVGSIEFAYSTMTQEQAADS